MLLQSNRLPLIIEVVALVKVEGTLDELREMFGKLEGGARAIAREAKVVEKAASKTKRKLSAWNKYVKNPKNKIKLKNGKLNLKKMAVQFRKGRRK